MDPGATDVARLDQQYIAALQLRNQLIQQFNSSLQAQINEVQGRGHATTNLAVGTQAVPLPNVPETTNTNGSEVDKKDEPAKPANEKPEPAANGTTEDVAKADEPVPEKKRFRVVVNKWNSTTQKWEDREDQATLNSNDNDRHIIYRRLMDSENERKCYDEECDIPLPGLKALLQNNMSHVETEWFETDSIAFDSPFANIIYNWETLNNAVNPQENDNEEMTNSRGDLKLLLDNIRISEPRRLRAYFKERESLLRAKTVTFGTLWALFQPGMKVLAKPFMDEWQMFEVQTNWCYVNPSDHKVMDSSVGYDRYRFFHLFCAGFDWDGRHFRRYTYRFTFEKFEGRRSINGLQCFPVEYWSADNSRGVDISTLKEQLMERGEKFARLCTAKKEDYLCKYGGFLLHGLPPRIFREPTYRTMKREIKKQSVIVDNVSYMESRRNKINDLCTHPPLGSFTWIESVDCCPCVTCRSGPVQSWSGTAFEDPEKERREFVKEPERLLLCPPKVLGYVPMERLWAQFSVNRLEEISQDQKEKDKLCFEQKLELDKKHKDMLLALIKNHESRKHKGNKDATVQDPIDGKGRGLAILLHGPPGVGKTLTAEAVALATAKPLLFVSVAELGNEPHVAEENLLDMFADASSWDAVMVIDEADVFLEERIGTGDINRNALVSVLLRVLEYYDGIIILTTNRITSLDVAVQSRMHLAIQYKDLSEQQKKSIFKKFLDDIPAERIRDREMIDRQLDWICKRVDLNGRQIRNIVSGAQALANSERQRLSYDHLSAVYESTADFVQSLKDLTLQKRGRNEAPRP